MFTRCFERENEIVNISDYGFEWYKGDRVIRSGLVEDIEADIEALKDEGFVEVL